MNKNTLIFAIGLIPLILLIALVVIVLNRNNLNNSDVEQILISPSATIQNTQTAIIEETPQEVLEKFFRYINEDKINLALDILSEKLVGNDPPQLNSTLQAYGVTFNHWESVELTKVDLIEDLSNSNTAIFLVDFDLKFKPNVSEPVYNEGQNTRFITLEKTEELNSIWEITSIATSF